MEENALVLRTSQKFFEDLGGILDLDSMHGISPRFAKAIIQWVQEHKERMTLEQRNIYQTIFKLNVIERWIEESAETYGK